MFILGFLTGEARCPQLWNFGFSLPSPQPYPITDVLINRTVTVRILNQIAVSHISAGRNWSGKARSQPGGILTCRQPHGISPHLPHSGQNLTSPAPLWISPHLPHSGRNLTSPAPLWISPYLPHSGLKVPPLVSFFLLWHKTQNPVLWVKCCPVYERLSPWDPPKVQTKNEKHVRMDAYSPSSRLF